MEQERASREAAGEADLRRSIEASLAERVKEEKLKLSRKALELGKQKVTCFLGIHTNKRFDAVGLLLLILWAGSILAPRYILLCCNIAACAGICYGHVLVSWKHHLHWSRVMVLLGPQLLLCIYVAQSITSCTSCLWQDTSCLRQSLL